MKQWLSLLIGALVITSGSLVMAATAADEISYIFAPPQALEDPVHVNLIYENETIQPGRPFWVAVQMKIADNWHSYWKNPGEAGMAASIVWDLPEGFTAGPIQWPYPKRLVSEMGVGFGYEGNVDLLVEITPPATQAPQAPVTIGAKVNWLVCSDASCLPGESTAPAVTIPTSPDAPQAKTQWIEEFSRARSSLPKKVSKLNAKRKNHLVELQVDTSRDHVASADFFPEKKKTIDSDAKITLSKDPGTPGKYVVVMNETAKAEHLKGVLVLFDGVNSQAIDALEIDVPIFEDKAAPEVLSMAESPIKAIPMPPQGDIAVHHSENLTLGLALAMAFVGGMILNLMPCVLPVISLKIFSFIKMAGKSRKIMLKHGLLFAAGVLASFWLLAGVMLALQAYGSSVGWGFQLQEPLFVGVLASLLLVFGLSLFGVFELGTSVMSAAGRVSVEKDTGLWGSFMSGVLATAVATPCTGPFLGSAVGFAVTLSPLPAMMIFTFLGLGMAFPYLLLSTFPELLRFVPKPGPWMVTFKEVMGFFIMATVLWLVWVFGAQTSNIGVFLLLAAFFFLALGSWIYGKWGSPVKKKTTRMISYALATACVVIASYAIINSATFSVSPYNEKGEVAEGGWEAFSPERVAELQKQGIPVLVDFTAKWCLICQANHVVLDMQDVAKEIADAGAVKMVADWTRNDPVITEELRKFGRNSVPLYVIYHPDSSKSPVVLPQVLTPDAVRNGLETVKTGK